MNPDPTKVIEPYPILKLASLEIDKSRSEITGTLV